MFGNNLYRQTLSANPQGRDFVVGDLHGCRELLDETLAKVSFDLDKDRLFCTGDLVDRGPDSEGCLDLLKEPWFHSVLGNHDAMLMAWILGPCKGDERQSLYEQAFVSNEGWQWIKRYHRASDHLPLLEKLPFILEVEGQFQVVHAEALDTLRDNHLAPDSREAALADRHYVRGFEDTGDWLDHLLWGRSIHWAVRQEVALDDLPTPDLPVYCGHTIVPGVQTHAGHTFLDIGAYRSGRLAMLGPIAGAVNGDNRP